MPTLSSLDIPPPRNWQDFELLCCDLWRRIWNDPEAQMHGRSGQKQHGVDVFGRPGRGPELAGLQCKLKSQLSGGQLSRAEIAAEVRKAEKFEPPISSFVVATTSARDAAVQKASREISEQRVAEGSFPVTVVAWEDILQDLAAHPDLVAKHFPSFSLQVDRSEAATRDDYLRNLWSRLLPVPMLGIGGPRGQQREIPLSAVYTSLDVTAEIRVGPDTPTRAGGKEGLQGVLGLRGEQHSVQKLWERICREAEQAQHEREKSGRGASRHLEQGYGRKLAAIEVAAVVPRLVLVGAAGSGKSTFAKFLALSLAGELLGEEAASLHRLNSLPEDSEAGAQDDAPWPHGALFPAFVELKKFQRSPAFPSEAESGDSRHLLRYLDLSEEEDLGQLLRKSFGRGALLILDGLDETPSAEECRDRLRQVIASFARRYPKTRILVTSRPYAYAQGSSWRLDSAGFEEATLAPFDDHKTQAYVKGWYAYLADSGQVDPEQAGRRADDLCRQVRSTPYLKPLAERPLMLTMMADLHAAGGGRLRGGRAGLYEKSVDLLLDRWNELRSLEGGESVSELLGMSVDQMRVALERLAYDVHREHGMAAGQEAVEISDAELWRALDRERPRDRAVDERRVMDYLHQRSGILVGESPTIYRFPHRSYQEYLAACHLKRTEFPSLILSEVDTDPALWREVVLLAVGSVAAAAPFAAWALLEGLVPRSPQNPTVDDPVFLKALYAALAVRENELWQKVQAQDEPKLERIRQWLERSLVVGALSPPDRAEAGRVLALLGDRRPGVGLGQDGLPDLDWVEIPAGKFTLGTDVGFLSRASAVELDVDAFRISRYPVTNAQYRAFVDDGGYTERWRACWSKAGWNWKKDRNGPDDDLREDFLHPSHPRVAVSWYEAHAFCRWLTARLDQEVRLPTEAEWEKAARGAEGRTYAWGDTFDAAHCNAHETGLGTTCAVGMFPSGASPYGVLDMAGNVWEWCSTEWRQSYEEPANEGPEGRASRVVRGGSFDDDQATVRCAFRAHGAPFDALASLGFRVCAPISETPDSENSDL